MRTGRPYVGFCNASRVSDFTAFFLDEGRVTAALTVGRSDDLEHAGRYIKEDARPDRGSLADESTDLASL